MNPFAHPRPPPVARLEPRKSCVRRARSRTEPVHRQQEQHARFEIITMAEAATPPPWHKPHRCANRPPALRGKVLACSSVLQERGAAFWRMGGNGAPLPAICETNPKACIRIRAEFDRASHD